MTQSPPPGLVEATQALRTWIESRQFEGYEPFDLLNSPYLGGSFLGSFLATRLYREFSLFRPASGSQVSGFAGS